MTHQVRPALVVLVAILSNCRGPSEEDGGSGSKNSGAWIEESPHLAYRNLKIPKTSPGNPLFERITSDRSGIRFENRLEFESFHENYYLVAGAGVTVGDYDGDGLPDVFMAGQDSGSRLFRQTAPWVFEDVTVAAGLPLDDGWAGGTAFADMDGDGDLDLFVTYRGAKNRYYANLGNGTFSGSEFALQKVPRSAPNMIAVMDHDLDGDLDAYLVGNRLQRWKEKFNYHLKIVKNEDGTLKPAPEYEEDVMFVNGRHMIEMGTRDFLLINEGGDTDQVPVFQTAGSASGLMPDRSLGLAATWFDADNDRRPDLYVSNDFEGPDHFYFNRGERFEERTGESLGATSLYSMGADYGDLNNDGLLDLITADMSNTTHFKSKVMMGDMDSLGWLLDLAEPRQAMRNFVHINAGTGDFLESAFYSGLSSTDWTWSVLCGDLDLDGREDVYFTNGLFRNLQDADFDNELKRLQSEGAAPKELTELCREQPAYEEKNLCFRNEGDLRFSRCEDEWGLGLEAISHGAVMADLDRDGDLDLIVNNQNSEAALYRNNSEAGGRLLISLRGTESNSFGLGARVVIEAGGITQTRYVSSSRGYCSGAEPVVHYGAGDVEKVETLTVYWPSGETQRFHDLPVNRHYRITEGSSEEPVPDVDATAESAPIFEERDTPTVGLDFEHRENRFSDFAIQPLLPNRISKMGPSLTSGDVDGNGLADIYVGGAHEQSGSLFLQLEAGRFERREIPVFQSDADCEDTGAVLFDADGDKDLDLYVVSGGNFAKPEDSLYQDRLYFNQGDGTWTKSSLPTLKSSGKSVTACDFDRDGDQDLFVGGRIVPHNYPFNPGAVLLVNHEGSFSIEKTAGFEKSGMVTDARWADVDGDDWPDLLVAVEWGSVRLWHNDHGKLVEVTADSGLAESSGWWMSIEAGDFDGDGDTDFIAGNWGLNSKYKASQEKSVNLYAGDFGDGNCNLVESWTKQDKIVPVRGLSCSSNAMHFLKEKFPTYRKFASASLESLYTPDRLENAKRFEVNILATSIFLNDGTGKFKRHDAPAMTQLAPVMSINVADVDGDDVLDCLLAQNNFTPQRETGRANGGLCVVLKGAGDGTFEALWPSRSGVSVRVDPRNSVLADFSGDGRPDWLIGANSGKLRLLISQSGKDTSQ